MAGQKESRVKLNRTLLYIARLLHAHGLHNWFVAYDTLLGLVRAGSCIEGDDDVDIIIDSTARKTVADLLVSEGFELDMHKKNFIKTHGNAQFASIDFYCANYNPHTTDFHDTWENVRWTKCKTEHGSFSEIFFGGGVKINLPAHAEVKLEGRYGKNWRIPQPTKGPTPRKTVI